MRIVYGATAAVLAMSMVGCGADDGRPPAWDPAPAGSDDDDDGGSTSVDADSTGLSPDDDGADDSTDGAPACTPGESTICTCPDGSDGVQVCVDDGSGFGPCTCDDEGDDTSTGEPGSTGGEQGDVVCYPGQSGDFTTCVPLHTFETMPEGYEYPPPYMGDDNYRPPVALIDLEEIDPGLYLAPNFQLDEIAQAWKGRYAIVQPHAIVSLQAMRDEVGAISVNSGYRSPGYNATLDGAAMYSRHMYGDAYDLDPIEVGLSTLEQVCVDQGGMLVEYTSHVHCDFRFDPVDELFFGPAMAGDLPPPPSFEATIVHRDDGSLGVWADGFDEGTPARRWTALDAAGEVIASGRGERFSPPPGAATVEVRVGAQVERSVSLP